MPTARAAVAIWLVGLTFLWSPSGEAVRDTRQDNPDSPIALGTLPNVDETLFLIRALEDIYERWPGAKADRDQISAWIPWTRQHLARLRAWIRTTNLNPDVGRLYDDALGLVDGYETFLVNLGAIDGRTADQKSTDTVASFVTGYRAGSAAEADALRRGVDRDTASSDAAWKALFDGLGEAFVRTVERDTSRKSAIDAEQRKLASVWTMTSANAEAVAAKLTNTYGWTTGEAGFDGFRGAYWNEYTKRRPRDPFVLVSLATTRVKDETPTAVLQDAETCLRAAQLVPPGRIYDVYRADFIAEATNLAMLAASREVAHYSDPSGPSSGRALRIARTYLAFDPSDASGRGHMQLARGLALVHRYTDAVAAANVARRKWEHDRGFRYRYARLMSLTNQPDLSGNWLAWAYQAGWSDVNFVRRDRDLDALRTALPARFAELTTPKLSFRFVWGILNDDIVLKNESLFDLTNVTATAVIRQGQRTWTRTLTCQLIRSGGECEAVNIVSIPGAKYDEALMTFTSDQSVK